MPHLLKSTLVVGVMTSISRVLGLIRDVIIARYFGAGLGVDVFIVVFRIPNFMRRLFAEGGFSQAFVPVLSEYKEQRSVEEVKALLDHTTATLGTILFIVSAAGVIAAPLFIAVFAPGFLGDQAKTALAASMLRITFPYIFFISLTALAGGVLNTYRNFAVPAVTPVFLNLSLIGCAVWLAPRFSEPVAALAWGVFIAGVVQLSFQLPFLLRLRLLPVPRFRRDREGVSRILKLMVPTLFAMSVTQVNLLVDTLIASFLQTGSISWLYYSDRLVEFPLGVFGIALATVILPSLSTEQAKGSEAGYSVTLNWALRWVFLITLPAAAGLALLAGPMLTTLFQYREFSVYDVEMASRSLMAYSVGLPAFVLIKVLSSGFFSRQDTKTPVKIGVVAMLANIVFNVILVFPLAHAGLALATSLAAYVNAGLLYFILHKRGYHRLDKGWPGYLVKLLMGLFIMTAVFLLGVPALNHWQDWDVYRRVIQLAAWIIAGASAYFAILWLSGLRFREIMAPS